LSDNHSGKFLKIRKLSFKLSAHLSLSLQTAAVRLAVAENEDDVRQLAIYAFFHLFEPLFRV
jgi:hypothetical protein